MNHQKPLICIVEDDADDRHLLQQAFASAGNCQLRMFASSEQFYRHMLAIDSAGPFPRLIVLDFNMPAINGGELLLRLKREQHLRHIPVVLYSTGMLPLLEETLMSYGAHRCFVKSMDYKALADTVRQLTEMASDGSVATG